MLWVLLSRHLVVQCVEQMLYVIKVVIAHIQLFLHCATAPSGQDLPIFEASRSHSVGLLWTRDKPDAETYEYT
jgi:NADH:ubiquinone oxidoreductase subunit H